MMVYTGVSTVRSRKLNISNIQMLQMRMEMEFDDLCQREKHRLNALEPIS